MRTIPDSISFGIFSPENSLDITLIQISKREEGAATLSIHIFQRTDKIEMDGDLIWIEPLVGKQEPKGCIYFHRSELAQNFYAMWKTEFHEGSKERKMYCSTQFETHFNHLATKSVHELYKDIFHLSAPVEGDRMPQALMPREPTLLSYLCSIV